MSRISSVAARAIALSGILMPEMTVMSITPKLLTRAQLSRTVGGMHWKSRALLPKSGTFAL